MPKDLSYSQEVSFLFLFCVCVFKLLGSRAEKSPLVQIIHQYKNFHAKVNALRQNHLD